MSSRKYYNWSSFEDNGTEITLNLKLTFDSFNQWDWLDKSSKEEIEKRIMDAKAEIEEYLYNKITTDDDYIDTDHLWMYLWNAYVKIERSDIK